MRSSYILLALLWSANIFAANYISVVDDNRYIRTAGWSFDNYQPKEYFDEYVYPDASGADFEYVGVFAPSIQQKSVLPIVGGTSDLLSASAEVYRDASSYDIFSGYLIEQDSIFDVTFTANTGFNYAVNFAGDMRNSNITLYSGAIEDGLNAIFSFSSDFDFDAVLMGGETYRLVASAQTINSLVSDASFNFTGNFSPTAVPVPAAAWLFGSALAGLGWLRRRKKA